MKALIRQLEDSLGQSFNDSLSFVCINTAESKYLVFQTDIEFPIYVMQFGDYKRVTQIYESIHSLWEVLPKTIPKPLIKHRVGTEDYAILIQEGAQGRPWFTLRNYFNSFVKWLELQAMAIGALNNFHEEINKKSNWVNKINLGHELELIANEYKSRVHHDVPSNFDYIVGKQVDKLSELGQIPCHFQHGDFCINNILVKEDHVSIIDFEYFGKVSVPYQDEFLLLDSLLDFAPDITKVDVAKLWDNISNRSRYKNILFESHTQGLYLYFLLWWGVETSINSKRNARELYYRNLLKKFCSIGYNKSKWQPAKYVR